MASALLAGATGLIGGHGLNKLLEDPYFDKVISIGRRNLDVRHPKLRQEVVDFEDLEAYEHLFAVDHVFCCLGTTIKTAGSQAAFRKVDEEYPIEMARLAKENDAFGYVIITSLGAKASSPIFYNKVKGQVQDAIQSMGIPSVSVLQPSILLGERREQRRGEQIGQTVMKATTGILVGPLRKYRPIEGEQVAKAMIEISKKKVLGFTIYPSDQLQKF